MAQTFCDLFEVIHFHSLKCDQNCYIRKNSNPITLLLGSHLHRDCSMLMCLYLCLLYKFKLVFIFYRFNIS